MTPLHIELILHYAHSSWPFYRPSTAATEYTEDLERMGLVEKTTYGHGATPRGRAYVALLLETPVPCEGFYDPRDKHLINA